MLRLPKLNILTPNTLTEALTHSGVSGTTVVAGGTDLLPNLKRRQVKYHTLVYLTNITELHGISGNAETGLVIGATTTLTEIVNNPIINTAYPALARAAYLVSTPQLRNVGTLAGNVCLDTRCMYYNQNKLWRQSVGYCLKAFGSICQAAPKSSRCFAVSSADTVPVLVALAARLRLSGPDGEREIPIEDFYGPDGINYLTKQTNEIVTAIIVPPVESMQMIYLKMRKRSSFDFPVASVAVTLAKSTDNKVKRVRVVLGALESRPLLLAEASGVIQGNELTHEIIETVAEMAFREARPVDNTDMPPTYRKQMARVLTSRALHELSAITHVHGNSI